MPSTFARSGQALASRSMPLLANVGAVMALFLGLLLPSLAQAAFTITRTSAPLMYVDTGDNLRAAYVSYQVTSSTAEADIWVGIGSFTGGVVSLSPNEDGIVQLGAFSTGQTKTAFFYVQASGTTTTAQGHTVSVYAARPPGTALQSSTFSLSSVDSTISANANKVNTVVTGPDPAGLGGIVTMTVSGETGTIGAAGILSFSPATYTGWRADVFKLFDSQITLPSAAVLSNQLYTSGYGTGGAYTLVYRFKAIGTTTGPTSVSPVGYISSGTQIKHTSTSGFGSLPAISSPNNTLTLAKSVNPTAPNGGDTITYTLRLTNSAAQDVSVERIVDTLPTSPATPSLVNGSSTWGGAAIANPSASGATLTWSGVFTVPAGSTRDLSFQAVLPSSSGGYVNSAIAYIGTTQIDTTQSTSDNSPATATVTIGPDLTLAKTHSGNFTQAQTGASYTLTVSNSGNASSSGTVTVTDTLPGGLTPTAAAGTGWSCGIAGQVVTCTRSDALAAGASHPAITLTVNVSASAAATLVNTASVSGGSDANTGNNSAADSTTINPAPADLSVALSGLPSYAAPGAAVTGNVVCSNAGPGSALNATCSASVPSGASVSVGTCVASSGTAASLPSGATLTCALSITVPGTAGGTDTAATSLTVSATTAATNDSNSANDGTSSVLELVDAVNEAASLPASGGSVPLRANDTIGAAAATNANSTIAISGALPAGFSFDSATGILTVAGGTASNVYSIGYQLCVAPATSPATCDSAAASVTVGAPADMAVVVSGLAAYAVPGSTVTAAVTCTNGGGAAATNATCSGSGLPAGATFSCSPTSPQTTLAAGASITCSASFTAPPNGTVTLAATTSADADASSANNSASASTAVIDAVADSATVPTTGGSVPMLANDTLGGVAASTSSVGVTITSAGGLAGASVDGAGNLIVPAGTAAGSYVLTYRICALASTSVCDSATATITVPAPAATADMAVALSGLATYAAPGSTVTTTVICTNAGGTAAANASCIATGMPTGASFNCSPATPQATLAAGASITCSASFTAPASGTATITATAAADSDANLANNSASATTAVVRAVADTASVGASGGSVALLGNDTLGTVAATPVAVTLTAVGTLPTGFSLDAATGRIVVAAGTPDGSYAIDYRLCALGSITACDVARATLTVGDARLDVVKSAGSPAYLQVGASAFEVRYRISVKNPGVSAVPNVQVTDNLAVSFAAGSPTVSVLGLAVTAGPCTANPAYDAVAVAGLLTGTDNLAPGAVCTIDLRARIAYTTSAVVSTADNGNLAYASGLPGAGPNPGHTLRAGSAPVAPAGSVALDVSNNAATLPTTPNGDDPAGSATPLRLPRLATLAGTVFFDANGNGRADAGEIPRSRYLVQVVRPSDPANLAAGATLLPYLQAVSNADGSYTVPGVPTDTALALRFVPLVEGSGTTPDTATIAVPAGTNGTPVIGGMPVNGAPTVNTSSAQATRGYLPVNVASASLPADGVVPQQNLPIDPSGVVYDSASREPVAGATVQLLTAAGAPVPAGTIFAGGAASVITNADGVYAFLLDATAVPGSYRLAVTPPATHVASSVIPPAAALTVPAGAGSYLVQPQATAPALGQDTTWHLAFNFSTSRDVVHNHIPLDRLAAAALFIEKLADKRSAEIGDSVQYLVRVRNPNTFSVAGVRVDDRLPLGFKLIAGSTRVSVAGVVVASAEPAGAPGPALAFTLGALAANSEATVTYRVRIGFGADRGTGINSAQASATGMSVASRIAQATVRVQGGVFTRDACVIGKVYLDCNDNGVQDAGEVGIPGVRLVVEDGTSVTTDENGQYSLCGLRAITHAMKVDPRSLPAGSELGLTGSRNAGDADSLFIDLQAGELHRADFRVRSCTPKVTEAVEQRRRSDAMRTPSAPDSGGPPGARFDSERNRIDQLPAGSTK